MYALLESGQLNTLPGPTYNFKMKTASFIKRFFTILSRQSTRLRLNILIFYINNYRLFLFVLSMIISLFFRYLFWPMPTITPIGNMHYTSHCIDALKAWFHDIMGSAAIENPTPVQEYDRFTRYINLDQSSECYDALNSVNIIYLRAFLRCTELLSEGYHITSKELIFQLFNELNTNRMTGNFALRMFRFLNETHTQLYSLDYDTRVTLIKNLSLILKRFNDPILTMIVSYEYRHFDYAYPDDVKHLMQEANKNLEVGPKRTHWWRNPLFMFDPYFNKKPLDITELDWRPKASPLDGQTVRNTLYGLQHNFSNINVSMYPRMCETLIDDICRHLRFMNAALDTNGDLSERQIMKLTFNFLLNDHFTDYKALRSMKFCSPQDVEQFTSQMANACTRRIQRLPNNYTDYHTIRVYNVTSQIFKGFNYQQLQALERRYGLGIDLNFTTFQQVIKHSKIRSYGE
jgi:hypothetical protein